MLTVEEATALARDAAREAAALAAREAIEQLLAPTTPDDGSRRRTGQLVRLPGRPVADEPDEPAQPPAAPSPQAELAAELAESVARHPASRPTPEPVVDHREPATSESSPRVRDRQTPATAEKEAAADLFVAECVEHDERSHEELLRETGRARSYVTAPELLAAYEAWRPRIDAPPLTATQLGGGMTRAGYVNRRQARTSDAPEYREKGATRPQLYFGVRIRESADDAAPEDHTGTPSPTLVERPEPSEIERERARRRTARECYSGHRPGREVTREYRERIILPLIEQGWTYYRANSNGKGKPRVVSPRGDTYALANTPSDWRGLKNAQSYLRRLGAVL